MPLTFTRLIYVYREKSTGRAVYVGSAFDPSQRDRQHCAGTGIPFDREIQKRGRESFTLEIVESLNALTATEAMKAAVNRENHWMDVFRTYRTEACFNFCRSRVQWNNEERRAAALIAMAAAVKSARARPEVKSRCSAATKIAMNRTETKVRLSAASKEVHSRIEVKAQRSASLRATLANPEARVRMSEKAKIAMNRPEVKAHCSEVMNLPERKMFHSILTKRINHARWHTACDIISPACALCAAAIAKAGCK